LKATAANATLKFWHDNGKLKPEITLALTDHPEQIQNTFSPLIQAVEKGKKLSVTIEPARKKRSLDSNSYLWILCQKIAESIRTTKEEVYRKLVRDVGQFEIVPIRADAVNEFIRMWSGRGLGWFAEAEGDSKLDGYCRVVMFFGSSVYDSTQMAILIDEAVTQAKELGLETLPPDELEAMKNLWEGKA
jgi:DNA-binding XRE family transcriptional regulator